VFRISCASWKVAESVDEGGLVNCRNVDELYSKQFKIARDNSEEDIECEDHKDCIDWEDQILSQDKFIEDLSVNKAKQFQGRFNPPQISDEISELGKKVFVRPICEGLVLDGTERACDSELDEEETRQQ